MITAFRHTRVVVFDPGGCDQYNKLSVSKKCMIFFFFFFFQFIRWRLDSMVGILRCRAMNGDLAALSRFVASSPVFFMFLLRRPSVVVHHAWPLPRCRPIRFQSGLAWTTARRSYGER